jgi:2-oxoacid:acceptor oxidoreductase gamma subunit (pyruvate/2-ketoisovalerate family)
MFEIRFHGRGGQGSVIASEILSKAVFLEGKDVQSFPFFGVERRGAPVQAYTRIDDKPIRVKANIYTPDCVVVLDPSLLKSQNVTAGLKEGGYLLINTEKKPEELTIDFKGNMATVDATAIAVKLDSITAAISESVPNKPEANAAAAKEAFEKVLIRRMAA